MTKEITRTFHIVDSAPHEDGYALDRLAHFIRRPAEEIRGYEVEAAYASLRGTDALSALILEGYLVHTRPSARYRTEEYARLKYLLEGVLDTSKGVSYGTYLPSYLESLFEYSIMHGLPTDHRALLVGAVGVDSVREFVAGVRAFFPAAETLVVDKDREAFKNGPPPAAQVQVGDALDLPFEEEFQSVHTSALLHHLVRGIPFSAHSEVRSQFFSGVYRSLSPDGILVMIEQVGPHFPGRPTASQLEEELDAAGFVDVLSQEGKAFSSRREVSRYLRGTNPNLSQFDIGFSEEYFHFVGSKPA